jgi:hypothetical protein
MLLHYLLIFFRFVIGLAFLFSVGGKMKDIGAFVRAVRNFQILPDILVRPAAIGFVLYESLIIIFIIMGRLFMKIGFASAIALLIIFSTALISVLLRKLQVVCNCFGPNDKSVSVFDVVRNAILISCAMGGLHILGMNLFEQPKGSLPFFDVVLLGIISLLCVHIFTNLSEVTSLFRTIRKAARRDL